MGDLGCGQPILIRVYRRGALDLAVMNKPASSDFIAKDMTNLMIWVTMRTGPLSRGTASSYERKIDAPYCVFAPLTIGRCLCGDSWGFLGVG